RRVVALMTASGASRSWSSLCLTASIRACASASSAASVRWCSPSTRSAWSASSRVWRPLLVFRFGIALLPHMFKLFEKPALDAFESAQVKQRRPKVFVAPRRDGEPVGQAQVEDHPPVVALAANVRALVALERIDPHSRLRRPMSAPKRLSTALATAARVILPPSL